VLLLFNQLISGVNGYIVLLFRRSGCHLAKIGHGRPRFLCARGGQWCAPKCNTAARIGVPCDRDLVFNIARTVRVLNSDFQTFDNSTATQCGRNAHIERVFLAQVIERLR